MRGPTGILAPLAALLVLLTASPASGQERPGPCDLHQDAGETMRQHSKELIRCAAHRWDVPGGAERAICIADAESGLNPKSRSDGNEYVGLFQHSRDAWPDRYDVWTHRAWRLNERATSGRTNAIVTMRMVNASGWGPWRGVDGC